MRKFSIILIALILALSIGITSVRWMRADAGKDTLPNIESHDEDAGKEKLSNIARHNEDVSIYVDFGIDCAYPRFFVFDNRTGSLLSSSKCTHGCGGGSTISKPVFSNKIGSNCSSLGEYKLTTNSRLNGTDIPCIRLIG